MAGVYSKAEDKQIEPSMTCCLGNHPLSNPRLLPCQHSFCTECIKSKVGDERKEFVCPKCQLSIPLTEKEVDQLPEDVLYHVIQETKGKAECVFCKFEGKKTPGTFQCLDCADIFCDQCQKGHTKSSFTLSHRVVTIKEIQEGKYKREIQAEKPQLCPTHSNAHTLMPLQYYCEECKCLACQICMLIDHQPKGHTCKIVEEIHDEKVTAVKDNVANLQDLKEKIKEFVSVLEQELGQNKEQKEKHENEIHDRSAHFIEIIEKIKEDTLETIRGHFENEDTSIQAKLTEAKNRIIRIESLVSYTQAFLKQSAKSQFLQHENDMIKKLDHQNQHKMDSSLTSKCFEIGEPQYDQTKALIKEAFGKIDIKTKPLKGTVGRYVPRKLMKEPKVLFSVNHNFNKNYGIAVNENDDIISVYGSTIQIFNGNGNPKQKCTCSQLQEAWNVVSRGENLYVSSYAANGKVLVMDFKGIMKKAITLPEVCSYFRFIGLAVDAEGIVYITSHISNNIYKCEPNETNAKIFIPKGKHPHLNTPWFLSTTPGGELVVSNRGSNTVQVYDRQGEFLWQYRGQGDMALKDPYGVCCGRDGYIYIADHDNHQIQVIKDQVFQGCIKIEDFTNPKGIAVDKDNNIACKNGFQTVKIKVWH